MGSEDMLHRLLAVVPDMTEADGQDGTHRASVMRQDRQGVQQAISCADNCCSAAASLKWSRYGRVFFTRTGSLR